MSFRLEKSWYFNENVYVKDCFLETFHESKTFHDKIGHFYLDLFSVSETKINQQYEILYNETIVTNVNVETKDFIPFV